MGRLTEKKEPADVSHCPLPATAPAAAAPLSGKAAAAGGKITDKGEHAMQPKVIPLKQEMTLLHLPQMPSRTDRLTAVLSVPLREETAAQYAALPGLLTRRCPRYPTAPAYRGRPSVWANGR